MGQNVFGFAVNRVQVVPVSMADMDELFVNVHTAYDARVQTAVKLI